MVADGAPVDLVTVTDRMTSLGTLGEAGGLVYLAELASSPASAAPSRGRGPLPATAVAWTLP